MESHCPQPILLGFLQWGCLLEFFPGAFPPMVVLIFFWAGSTPAGTSGPTSATSCASCQVRDDLGNLHCLQPLCSSFLLSSSLGEGGVLEPDTSIWACLLEPDTSVWACVLEPDASVWAYAWVLTLHPFFHQLLGITFILAMLEWKSKKWEVLAGFSEDTCYFYSTSCTAEIFRCLSCYNGRQIGLCFTCFGVEEKEFQEAMRSELGTTSLWTTNSSKIKFLKVFHWCWYYCPVYRNRKVKILN